MFQRIPGVFRQKSNHAALYQIQRGYLAGALGLEPRTKVLETHVLPLHHTPMPCNRMYYIAMCGKSQGGTYFFFEKAVEL